MRGSMRGILAGPVELHTPEGIVVIPSGSQVSIQSCDDWQHDVQTADIIEAVNLLEEV
jgi:hypothetical protein